MVRRNIVKYGRIFSSGVEVWYLGAVQFLSFPLHDQSVQSYLK